MFSDNGEAVGFLASSHNWSLGDFKRVQIFLKREVRVYIFVHLELSTVIAPQIYL